MRGASSLKGQIMVFIPRSLWGLPATWPNNRVAPSRRTGFVVHWDGGANPTDAAGEIRLLLAYHRYHLHSMKTGGFDYNLAVGPITGNIYEGRGLDIVGAHAGGANTPNIGVVLIGGPGNLTEAGKRGLREAYALACRHTGKTLRQLAHRDVNRTGCPGDEIAAWVHAGGLTGGSVPGTASGGGGGSNYRPGDITVGVSVKQVQERLVAHGFSVGKHGIDNDMGDDTINALYAFQGAQGIKKDAVVGPDTWRRLSAAPGAKPTGIQAPPFPLPNDDYFFGPEGLGAHSISGHHSHREDLRRWQQQMQKRGWDITPDGLFSARGVTNPAKSQTGRIAIAFQKEKRLRVDGKIGAATWAAAWTEPVT